MMDEADMSESNWRKTLACVGTVLVQRHIIWPASLLSNVIGCKDGQFEGSSIIVYTLCQIIIGHYEIFCSTQEYRIIFILWFTNQQLERAIMFMQ